MNEEAVWYGGSDLIPEEHSLKFSDNQQSPGRRSFNLSEPEFSKPRKSFSCKVAMRIRDHIS